MKRVFSLVAGITGVFASVIAIVLSLINAFDLQSVLSSLNGFGVSVDTTGYYVLLVAIMLFGVVTLILNAVCINSFNCDVDKFKKKTKSIITAIVFDFITLVLMLVLVIVLQSTVNTAIGIILMLIYLTSGAFFVVDLCLEDNRIAKQSLKTNTTSVVTPMQHTSAVKTNEIKTKDTSQVYKDLQLLGELRNNKIITEEEFQKLKKDIIK